MEKLRSSYVRSVHNIYNNLLNKEKIKLHSSKKHLEAVNSSNQQTIKKVKYSNQDFKIAKRSYKKIKENHPNLNIKFNKDKWSNTIRLLRTSDGFTYDQINQAINFALNHDNGNFSWKQQLQSIVQLRQKKGDDITKFQKIFSQSESSSAPSKDSATSEKQLAYSKDDKKQAAYEDLCDFVFTKVKHESEDYENLCDFVDFTFEINSKLNKESKVYLFRNRKYFTYSYSTPVHEHYLNFLKEKYRTDYRPNVNEIKIGSEHFEEFWESLTKGHWDPTVVGPSFEEYLDMDRAEYKEILPFMFIEPME